MITRTNAAEATAATMQARISRDRGPDAGSMLVLPL
eukprot:CAMPEP_0172768428 /NCGR_PEP_ID=MMETSP1074-20121228/184716_1 /TAXON_ID=2916 /ORGANISM="Ceratium fusus, Strain PA161109" /LENGTH=35 /DNA_ID= /DNA_START= /DNA_END= /DNA_ORIENTATION=